MAAAAPGEAEIEIYAVPKYVERWNSRGLTKRSIQEKPIGGRSTGT
jgi:hypothetical protein